MPHGLLMGYLACCHTMCNCHGLIHTLLLFVSPSLELACQRLGFPHLGCEPYTYSRHLSINQTVLWCLLSPATSQANNIYMGNSSAEVIPAEHALLSRCVWAKRTHTAELCTLCIKNLWSVSLQSEVRFGKICHLGWKCKRITMVNKEFT